MTFLVALVLVLVVAWIVFAIIDRIVGWAFERRERVVHERYPEEFLYADPARLHREAESEVDRLAGRVPPPQLVATVAGAASQARGPYRSTATVPRLVQATSGVCDLDRQSEYGQSTSLVGSAASSVGESL
jgi:hypothetical protein